MNQHVIWKYPLEVTEFQIIKIPRARMFLTPIQLQRGIPCVWAEVNPESALQEVTIFCRGTGHVFEVETFDKHHLGTVQMGDFVWHFFADAGAE